MPAPAIISVEYTGVEKRNIPEETLWIKTISLTSTHPSLFSRFDQLKKKIKDPTNNTKNQDQSSKASLLEYEVSY